MSWPRPTRSSTWTWPRKTCRNACARAGSTPANASSARLGNFFTESNLTRLRELALEEIAHLLDRRRQLREGGEIPPGFGTRAGLPELAQSQHAAVAAQGGPAGRSPERALVRHLFPDAARAPEKVAASTQRQIADTLTLAQHLGGNIMPFEGPTFERAVADFVQEYGITHVLVGRSRRPWYQRWFGQSPLDRLLRAVPEVDVLVVGKT